MHVITHSHRHTHTNTTHTHTWVALAPLVNGKCGHYTRHTRPRPSDYDYDAFVSAYADPDQPSPAQPSLGQAPHSRCAMVSAVGHNSRATGSTRDGDQRTYHLPAGLTANTARGHGNCHCHCLSHCSSQHGSRQVQSCASHLLWILLFINFTSVMYSCPSCSLAT